MTDGPDVDELRRRLGTDGLGRLARDVAQRVRHVPALSKSALGQALKDHQPIPGFRDPLKAPAGVLGPVLANVVTHSDHILLLLTIAWLQLNEDAIQAVLRYAEGHSDTGLSADPDVSLKSIQAATPDVDPRALELAIS